MSTTENKNSKEYYRVQITIVQSEIKHMNKYLNFLIEQYNKAPDIVKGGKVSGGTSEEQTVRDIGI